MMIAAAPQPGMSREESGPCRPERHALLKRKRIIRGLTTLAEAIAERPQAPGSTVSIITDEDPVLQEVAR